MRLGSFDLNLLVTFDALLDTRSVTRASARLHIGQSATSSALGKLREHFDDALLVRVGRRMALTPKAMSLVQPVRDTLLQIQGTITPIRQFDPRSAERCFVIRATDYLTTVLLVELMQRLQREAPKITLQVSDVSEDVTERLNRGELDLVLTADVNASPGHPREKLFDEECVCVTAADNPMVGESLTLEDYVRLGHVAVRVGISRTAFFESWLLDKVELKRSVEVTVNSFNALPQFLLGTNRISVMHRRLAEWHARSLPLRILPPPINFPLLSIVMQWNQAQSADPGSLWLRSIIVEQSRRARNGAKATEIKKTQARRRERGRRKRM